MVGETVYKPIAGVNLGWRPNWKIYDDQIWLDTRRCGWLIVDDCTKNSIKVRRVRTGEAFELKYKGGNTFWYAWPDAVTKLTAETYGGS